MTTVKEREIEELDTLSPAAVAGPEVMAPAAPTAEIDVSTIPETPEELLNQWTPAKKPLLHVVIAAALIRVWDSLTGPAMTEQERLRREVQHHSGYACYYRRNV